jgi:hypothetical protein
MKFNKIYIVFALLPLLFTSCFEENDEGIYDIVGPVATISVFTPTPTQPNPGSQVSLRIRFYSENVAVRQLRFNTIIGGVRTNVTTRDIANFNTANSYEETFTYQVPADMPLNTVVTLEVEIQTVNDLVNFRRGNITVR